MTMRLPLLVIGVSLLCLVLPRVRTISAQASNSGVGQRPMNLPVVGVGEACPVSVGARDKVPSQPHIFGAGSGSLWFGAGPVYFAWTWKKSRGDDATFSLDRVPVENGASRAKTPWVSVPSYSGPIVIRGRELGPNGKALLFSGSSSPGRSRIDPKDNVSLQAPNELSPSWSFWPSSIHVPGPGCYGLQIDTTSATDVVIFQAIKG